MVLHSVVRSRARLRFFALSVIVGASAMSCGSRTGLFGPDETAAIAPQSSDASPDRVVDAGLDAPIACTPGEFTFELALTQLMFVIDRSGSMAFDVDGARNRPRSTWRWSLLQSALRRAITAFDEQIAMGAKFYPEPLSESDLSSAQRSCRSDVGVGIAPARGNAETILDVFDTTTPRGGTPTAEAIRTTSDFLRRTRSIARTIVLATDGAPNCNGSLDANACVCTSTAPCGGSTAGRFSCLDDDRTISAIRDTAQAGNIPVYVIGIGGTEAPEFLQVLDEMAVAGGRPRPTSPRHYNVQSEDELTAALESIRDSVARCTYLTPSAPTDPSAIAVRIGGAAVDRDQTKQNGWDWVDRELGALAFFGEACTKAQNANGAPAVVTGVVRCD